MYYNLLWVAFKFSAGFLVYTVFKTNWLYIILSVLAAEIIFYIVYKKHWLFIKRYLFNLAYLLGYLTPLLFT